ncbi:P-loop containing nucleoside triphosphate hydrolase protein [Lentinula aciculospora]|uniref:P-loop containing nucleoside triphosphate hydrolase protein n=1 Tax=Lentinula aciculospora TaxID=153920 RepID=A0A9W9DP49_9AGAR|nr:P-loop containing nucleoside triphosphate hydrolase protein [Lentinula aciculospora]
MADTKRSSVEESFVDDWDDVLTEIPSVKKEKQEDDTFYGKWTQQASAKHADPILSASEALRKIYPEHSMVTTSDSRLHPFTFPGAQVVPLDHDPLVTTLGFAPLSRSSAPVPGVLTSRIIAGGFKLKWQNKNFILHVVQYPLGLASFGTQSFILHEGSEEPARQLLLACGLWSESIHNEIWVFNQGFWQKDGGLWDSIQQADWKDVILKDKFKKAFQKDIYGFFDSEHLYKELGIPWKRGLIMHGPPGNGKTISLKTVMKTCDAKGYTPLYVKSFQSFAGDEYSMRTVFNKARQLAPCVLVLEDLDSLITDRNRSFFLNELDGLEGNQGLLVLGTTNHFDRLDPGLSTRPSRFDRKYLFDDPDRDERALYAVYWQDKLKTNKSIDFPDVLVDEVADATDRFSFAYLKEAFVSALVTLAGLDEDEKSPFGSVLMDQIDILSKQLDKPKEAKVLPSPKEKIQTHLAPISRPLPQPGTRARINDLRRQSNNVSNDTPMVFVPPSPPSPPILPMMLQPHDGQRQFDSNMRALRAHFNALQVPGSFGNCNEDDLDPFFIRVPSPSQNVGNNLPGISGFWA